MIENITNIVSLLISAGTLIYLLISKIQDVKYIRKDVEIMSDKIDCIANKQFEHEHRLSVIEGKMNGNFVKK